MARDVPAWTWTFYFDFVCISRNCFQLMTWIPCSLIRLHHFGIREHAAVFVALRGTAGDRPQFRIIVTAVDDQLRDARPEVSQRFQIGLAARHVRLFAVELRQLIEQRQIVLAQHGQQFLRHVRPTPDIPWPAPRPPSAETGWAHRIRSPA